MTLCDLCVLESSVVLWPKVRLYLFCWAGQFSITLLPLLEGACMWGTEEREADDKERVFVIRVSLYSEFLFIQSNLIKFLYSFFLTPMKLIFKMTTTTNLIPIPFLSAKDSRGCHLSLWRGTRLSAVYLAFATYAGIPLALLCSCPLPAICHQGSLLQKNPFKLSLTPNLSKTPKPRVPTMHTAPPLLPLAVFCASQAGLTAPEFLNWSANTGF